LHLLLIRGILGIIAYDEGELCKNRHEHLLRLNIF
jgi:hypothetical protein